MIRVLVGSRSSVVPAGIESLVRSIPSIQFAGAVDIEELGPLEREGDVLLIENATERERELLSGLGIPMVLLMDFADTAMIGSALRAGIRGVIPRDATAEEIEGAVHAVNAGLVVTTPASFAELLPEESPAVLEQTAEPLSSRELEVLDLLAEGISNKLIAHRLSISEHTVKTHVASIFAKMGVSSRTEAVSQAIRRGLVML